MKVVMIRILEDYRFEYDQSELDKAEELWIKGWDYRDIAEMLEIEELEAFLILAHLDTKDRIKKRPGAIFGSVDNDQLTFCPNDYANYNEFYHPNDGKKWTEEEVIYLAKHYKHDGVKSISLGLGRTCKAVKNKYEKLSKTGQLERYRKEGAAI